MGNGKDRAKHDGGKDASGKVRDGAKHPESPATTFQPESGMPAKDQDEQRRRQDRTLDDDD